MNNTNKIESVLLTAKHDSPLTFMGERAYNEGDEFYGVRDVSNSSIYILTNNGGHFIPDDSVDFNIEVTGTSMKIGRDGLDAFLKNVELRKWVDDNVEGKYEVVTLYPARATQLVNNVKGNGGNEYISLGMSLLAVRKLEDDCDFMTQIRKGSLFYIPEVNDVFKIQVIDTVKALQYSVLKEIKFIIQNDYKYGGGKDA